MTDSIEEQLSACLDGELPESELALLAKRVNQNAELGQSLARYALIAEVVRTGKPVAPSRDFAAGVMARIHDEPSQQSARFHFPARTLRRLRPVAGAAIAASVAALAVFSVQRAGILPSEVTVANEQVSPQRAIVADEPSDRYVVPTLPTTSSAFIPATRLTNYVVAHSEYSSPLGRRTVLSGVLAEGESEDLGAPAEENSLVPQGLEP